MAKTKADKSKGAIKTASLGSIWGSDLKRVADDDNTGAADIHYDPTFDEDDVEDEEDTEEVEDSTDNDSNDEDDEQEEDNEDDDEEQDDSEDDSSDEEDEEDEVVSPYNAIVLDLIEKAGIESDELDLSEYDDNAEGAIQIVDKIAEIKFAKNIPDEWKSVIDAIKQGISPHEYFAEMDITPYDEADTDEPDTQEFLIREAAKLRGESEDKIDKKIERYKKADVMQDEALEAQEFLVKNQEASREDYAKQLKANEDNARKRQADFEKDVKSKIEKIDEIGGFDLRDKKLKAKLEEFILKPVDSKGNTAYTVKRNQKLIESAFFTMMEPDMKKVTKISNSKAVSKLEQSVNKYTDKGLVNKSGKGSNSKKNDSKLPGFFGYSREDRVIED